MLRKLKSDFVKNIGPLGGYRFAKLLSRNKPRILMYHRFSKYREDRRVSASVFESQASYLKNNYFVASLPDIFDSLMHGKPIPPNTIILTIDDGYRDFYDVSYPILRRYGLTATLYATTDFIDGKIWLWPDKIEYVLKNIESPSISVDMGACREVLALKGKKEKYLAWEKLVSHCILISEYERDGFIDEFISNSGVTVGEKPTADYAAMSWEQIRELSNNGINIGAHTQTHPILSKIDVSRLDDEINGSKQQIEEVTNKSVSCFCYPNGQLSDFTPLVKEKIKQSGYANATVAFYDNAGWSDPYEIRRHGVGDNMFQFYKAVSGVEYLSYLTTRKTTDEN